MLFTHPWALSLLLLLPLPWWLNRHRPPTRRLVVSNLFLWVNASADASDVAARRVKSSLVATLRTAILAALILAAAGPRFASLGPHAAIILDVSASMGARDGTTTRLESAKALAEQTIARWPSSTQVHLIRAGVDAAIIGAFTVRDGALARALAALEATAGAGDLEAAIQVASVAGVERDHIHVFTDRSLTNESESRNANWHRVGSAAENLALSMLTTDQAPGDSVPHVYAVLRNFGRLPHDARLVIEQSGRTLLDEPATLGPGGEHTARLAVSSEGAISARVVADDALAVDNERFAVVRRREPLTVTAFGPLPRSLERALRTHKDVVLTLQPAPPAATRGLNPGSRGTQIAVSQDCRALRAIPTNALCIHSGTQRQVAAPIRVDDARHPLAGGIDVEGILAESLSADLEGQNQHVVLSASGRPLVLANEHGPWRSVEFGMALENSEFSLSAAFPVLVANALNWLSTTDNAREIIAGEPLTWRLPDTSTATVQRATGQTVPARFEDGRLTVVDANSSGVYRVRTSAADEQFAVNPRIEGESNLSEEQPSAARDETASTVPSAASSAAAPALALVAIVLLALESRAARTLTVFHAAAAVMLIAAATGVRIPLGRSPLAVVVAADVSDSVVPRDRAAAFRTVEAFTKSMRDGDRFGLVTFGASAALERRPSEDRTALTRSAAIDGSSTDLAAGLRLAAGVLPPDLPGRILLLSDGRETAERAEATVSGLHGRVPVDVLPTGGRDEEAQRVVAVVAPRVVRRNESFPITVLLDGPGQPNATLALLRDDAQIASSAAATAAESIEFADRLSNEGFHAYRAVLNNSAAAVQAPAPAGPGAVVVVNGEPTILEISTDRGVLASTLQAAGMRVSVVSPAAAPLDDIGLSGVSAVVLDDVGADRFTADQLSALARYVQQRSGGLLVLGSAGSLALDGFPGSALGDVLPIDLRPRGGSGSPTLGMVVVFDKSGSMSEQVGGIPKIALARAAVRRVLTALPPGDLLGVVAFDRAPVAVAPLVPVQNATGLDERLGAIEPGGATAIGPAAEMAVQWLRAAATSVARRHILLVSDGRSSAADGERVRTAVTGTGITVSTIAIGPDADRALLQSLAETTGGRSYFPDDPSLLPQLAAREAARSAGGSFVRERVAVVGSTSPILRGLSQESLPGISGYVVAATKPNATNVLSSQRGDPILAAGQAGLGRVATFTADLRSDATSAFRSWRDEPRLWLQTMAWLARRTDAQTLDVMLEERDATLDIGIEAVDADNRPLALTNPHVTLRSPDGQVREFTLSAAGPGRYTVSVPVRQVGPYVATASAVGTDGMERHATGALYWTADRERTSRGIDQRKLQRLADLSGGRMLTALESPFERQRPWRTANPLEWLIGLALSLFVLYLLKGDLREVISLPNRFLRDRRTVQPRAMA